MHKHY